MINLLPPEQKKELLEEEKFKLVLILGILVLISLLSLFLILLSIKISIDNKLIIQQILLKEKEMESSQFQELEKEIKNLNFTFSELNSFYQKNPSLVKILEIISKTLPPETYLTSLNFSPMAKAETEKYLGEIVLNGYSPNREILLQFKENLEKEELFQEVYFPPTNWIEPTDINFKVNFKVKW